MPKTYQPMPPETRRTPPFPPSQISYAWACGHLADPGQGCRGNPHPDSAMRYRILLSHSPISASASRAFCTLPQARRKPCTIALVHGYLDTDHHCA